MIRKTATVIFSLAAIAACALFLYRRYYLTPSGPRPNILVLSACSLRQDMVPFMPGGSKENMPKVAEFFGRGSFIFPNAFNGLGWTALFAVTAPRLPAHWWDSVGYRLAGLWIKYHMYLVPPRHSWSVPQGEARKGIPPDSNFEKNYRESLEYFIRSLQTNGSLPYFVIAQIKYPHFPLIDRYNQDARWDRFLDEAEKARVAEYLKNPAKYAAKLPLLLMLSNDDKILRANAQVRAVMEKHEGDGTHDAAFLGLMTSPPLLAGWQASPDYQADLAILKKIYRANILYLDGMLGEILERLGKNGGLDNTVVIFTGDHGEVHMERGHLTHGTSWYDEGLRVPLLMRMPGQTRNKVIDDQVNFHTVTEVIRGIAQGGIGKNNFAGKLRSVNTEFVIGRDCSNTWRASRSKNKWKYAVDNATGETFVFDLEKDPGETNNLAPEQPELVAELERKYWENLGPFTDQMFNTCAPWAGGRQRSN